MTDSIHTVVERLQAARNFVNDIIWDRGLRAQMKQFATDVDEAATLISELQGRLEQKETPLAKPGLPGAERSGCELSYKADRLRFAVGYLPLPFNAKHTN